LNHQVHIYTDGAAKGNPGNGGYGVIVELVGTTYKKEFYEGFRHTTNNRMELLGVIVGLEKLKIPNMNVLVISDSKYVVDAVVKKWVFGWVKKQFKDKKNKDLWLRFLESYKKHSIQFIWVKGHASNRENNRCDELATQAADNGNLLIDTWYEEIGSKELFE